jgi:hypothetical protein
MKLGALKIDSTRAEQGAWISQIPDMGDLRLKVRGFGNSDYQRVLARETAAVPRENRTAGRIDPNVLENIMAVCMLETVLIDWAGLTGDDDQPIEYSKDMARTLLTDPDYRPFRDAVAWAARVVEEISSTSVEGAMGNSAAA